MKAFIAITLAVLAFAASGPIAAQQVNSMRGSQASTADQAPVERAYVGARPGTLQIIERTFKGQPPLIPHAIANIEEITTETNDCLECHISDEFKGKKMPKVSASHLVKGAPGAEPVLDMTRWQCNTCHVPQVDAKPLVDNTFRGLPARR